MGKFLGSAGCYRRFVQGFANNARLCSDLLIDRITKPDFKVAKKAPFEWKNAQQEAFDQLKEKLTNPPVLTF